MKQLLCTFMLAVAALVGSAPLAAAQTLEAIESRGKVLIAIDTAVPPYGMLDENMQPVGYDVDMAKMIAQDLGVELEIVPVTGPNRIAYLESNRADMVISTFGVTPERAKTVNFTIPYGANQIWIFGQKGEAASSIADLSGKPVAVVRGSIQDNVVTRMLPDAVIRRYEDDATAATAFLSGQVPFIATGTLIGDKLVARDTENYERKLLLGLNPYSIGLRKGDLEFLHLINTFIYSYRLGGQLNELSKKWIGAELGNLQSF
ncbi:MULTISPECIES: transporter substrate-binding domain-containing protein [Chelativorans]|uniref:Amino acid ABC transporter substrate-binding protein, PAAT family n=1 Tax=Chelativorans sp. (strain BNC1) TaxID=266779 RepID=Q11B80_CHESB|nr:MULTISPECIES: transporter substrate-binding domain-containing protein [Chelativorans]